MSYRLCGSNYRVCDCDDLAAQPCIASAIADYLDALRWGVQTNRADGGPGDEMSIAAAERRVSVTTRSFATIEACERWSFECGCGGFIRSRGR